MQIITFAAFHKDPMQIKQSIYLFLFVLTSITFLSNYEPHEGEIIDEFNGIPVYYNGKITNVFGRNIAQGGYNLGLKYQCVEFVKRYYYYALDHRMPDSYGHAKDFFDESIYDKGYNEERALMQYRNTREEPPKVNDILVYGASQENPFGHVGIVTSVRPDEIEIIQQNWGQKSRQTIQLVNYEGIYTVADYDVVGWLRTIY